MFESTLTKNELVDKIKYLEANPEIKERYKNAGKQYILDNFNLQKVGKIWDSFLQDLIDL
jgi:glycosyltransferase involved in cell wall biosynthesis